MSTMPSLPGGFETIARTSWDGRPRESLDPDDFTGGFGIWSGTSFSAPIAAGLIARKLMGKVDATGPVDTPAKAATVAKAAVKACFPQH